MAKVLCVSSQVVWGPVGNTAAVPALQEEGHDVLQLPTILLSHHPGHGAPVAQKIEPAVFQSLLASIEDKAALTDCAAVMTGYFANSAQIDVVAKLINRLRKGNPGLMVLIDPVIGDHGALYVPEDIATAIRQQLLHLANITTPNCFELSWLTGLPVNDVHEAEAAALKLSASEVIATSVPVSDRQLATVLLHSGAKHLIHSERRAHVPHGTGDFLAGCYLAHRLKQPPEIAFKDALSRLHQVIINSGDAKILRNT